MEILVKQLEDEGFTQSQIDEIEKGLQENLKVEVYAKKEFLSIQMYQIRLGLEHGVDVEVYARTEYDWFQMEEIRKGLEEGLDISIYASPDISYDRMQQVRLGLSEGINLSSYKQMEVGVLKQLRLAVLDNVNIVPYIVAGYDSEQLEAIRCALKKGIDVIPWVQKEYRGIALNEIFTGLENGLDVSVYAKVEYTWQQMREIRLGIEHMVDISLYNSSFYSYRQMAEIRKGLEDGLDVSYYSSPMYTAAEMNKRRKFLEENPAVLFEDTIEKPEITESESEDFSKTFNISISEDGMEAYIERNDLSVPIDRVSVVRALYKKGICYGIRYDVIDDMVNGDIFRKRMQIARGKDVTEGKDGWYEYFFRTNPTGIPKELENGRIDYRDVEIFEKVDKGQKLALYHNSEKGDNGITVTGNIIPAKVGREKNLLTGKGVKRLPDGKTYVSDIKGVVTLQDYFLNVSELLVMSEVNMATGNVEYDGNVLIEGNVSSGSTIKATKDIIVKGFVGAAQIICGGSVFLRQGMNGYGGGSINAVKDVAGYFFEDVVVSAGGDVQGDYFFKSAVNARGEVRAAGKVGAIAGGSVWAENGIQTLSLGNQAGLATNVIIGRMKRLRQKESELNGEIDGVNSELRILDNAYADFQKRYNPEVRNSMDLYLKIESAIYTKEKQLEELMAARKTLQDEILKSGAAVAKVDGPVYEGVSVEIDGAHWKSKSIRRVTLKKLDGRIVIRANY